MKTTVTRRTVDLSSYPDLVVIYLGMRVNRLAGIKTLFGFGPKMSTAVEAQPDGLSRIAHRARRMRTSSAHLPRISSRCQRRRVSRLTSRTEPGWARQNCGSRR